MLFAAIFLFHRLDLINISEEDIQEAIITVSQFSKNYQTFKYANELTKGIPLIYTWDEFSSIGRILKVFFNVHAKHFAMHSSIPEADFNEIEALSYGNPSVVPIFIYPAGERFHKARLLINTFKLMTSSKMTPLTFDMQGESSFAQITHATMFFEMVSERLAKKKKVQPESRRAIKDLRDKLHHL